MNRSQRLFVQDILDALEMGEQFLEHMSYNDFERDVKTQLALERLFTIIGEAVKKISPDLRATYPDVPWSAMAGMRDVLVHGYWAVRLNTMWETVKRDFPNAKPHVQRILDTLPPDEQL